MSASNNKNYDMVLKILLSGSRVEKNKLMLRYVNNEFREQIYNIGVEFMNKYEVLDKKRFLVQVWSLLLFTSHCSVSHLFKSFLFVFQKISNHVVLVTIVPFVHTNMQMCALLVLMLLIEKHSIYLNDTWMKSNDIVDQA